MHRIQHSPSSLISSCANRVVVPSPSVKNVVCSRQHDKKLLGYCVRCPNKLRQTKKPAAVLKTSVYMLSCRAICVSLLLSPCNGDALLLPSTQLEATLTHDCVIPIRHSHDRVMDLQHTAQHSRAQSTAQGFGSREFIWCNMPSNECVTPTRLLGYGFVVNPVPCGPIRVSNRTSEVCTTQNVVAAGPIH